MTGRFGFSAALSSLVVVRAVQLSLCLPPMPFSTILFNPAARVYTFRLVVAGAVVSAFWAVTLRDFMSGGTSGLIFVHHLAAYVVDKSYESFSHSQELSLVSSRLPVAALDLSVTVLEIILVAYSGLVSGFGIYSYILLLLIPLVAAAIFRAATIWASPTRFWRQKMLFLGGCPTASPPYTTWRILINRSLARPLVRGEFMGIIILRALILSAIVVAIPLFAIYSIIWIPLQAQVRTTIFSRMWSDPELDLLEGNATIIYSFAVNSNRTIRANVTAYIGPVAVVCPWDDRPVSTDFVGEGQVHDHIMAVAECPWPWIFIDNITFTLTFAPGDRESIVHVIPGQGNLNDLATFTDPIPILPGSHLFAYLTWTRRRIITTSSSLLLGPFTPFRTVMNMELNALQNVNNVNNPGPLSSRLLLVPRDIWPTKFLQDGAATPLDGISTVGGIWTFINGVFLLFFGANFMYFAFGRRPLSALGIAHLFQRRRLTRQWHEDFPALQTEGGQPGSESAGIVAFIRERLVDIEGADEKQTVTDAEDLEELTQLEGNSEAALQTTPAPSVRTTEAGDGSLTSTTHGADTVGPTVFGHRLNEIPLLELQHDWAVAGAA
ncbi:hypothetical protein DFH06DRAFT_1479115 [Mycena polygramma]|nr:hypothetical protein DFH06DRAFT_1479115 [Mycena polygramma]